MHSADDKISGVITPDALEFHRYICQTPGNLGHSWKKLANSCRSLQNAIDGKIALCMDRIKMASGHLGIAA